MSVTYRPRKLKALPAAIPPQESIANEVAHVAAILQVQCRRLERLHRPEADAMQTIINDLIYRVMPQLKLTACTKCSGYRDGDAFTRPRRCMHGEAS